VLADNPLGYWRLDETSGTSAADFSGNGRNGTYLNGVGLGVAGALANDTDDAARFDGVDDSVEVADDAALRLNGSFTIEFWARQISYVNYVPGILYKGQSRNGNGNGNSNNNGYAVFADPYGGVWLQRNNDDIGTGSGFLAGTFNHFAVTYDGTDVRWYVNGILRSTQAVSFSASADTTNLQIGKADFYGNNDLDEVAIYGTALSAAQIAAHYAAGS